MKRPWMVPAILSLALIAFFFPQLDLPLYNDEIETYFIPALKLGANWKLLLPWNYRPHDFFGHPPFFSALLGWVISVFHSLAALRIFMLLVSLSYLWSMYLVGGVFLTVLAAAHFLLLELGNILVPDVLLGLLFVWFAYFCEKKAWVKAMFLCFIMVLTRESTVFILIAYWMKGLFDRRSLTFYSAFLAIDFLWFAFLGIVFHEVTPVYLPAREFSLALPFLLENFVALFTNVFLRSGWIVLLLFLAAKFIQDLKEKNLTVWHETWHFAAIALMNFLILCSITASYSRYQFLTIVSLSLLLARHWSGASEWFRKGVVIALAPILGFTLYEGLQRTGNFRKSSHLDEIYACAELVPRAPDEGRWIIYPWMLRDVVLNWKSLQALQYLPVGKTEVWWKGGGDFDTLLYMDTGKRDEAFDTFRRSFPLKLVAQRGRCFLYQKDD